MLTEQKNITCRERPMSDKIITKKITSLNQLPDTLRAYSGYIDSLNKTILAYWEQKKNLFKGGELFLNVTVERNSEHKLEVPMIPGLDEFIKSRPLYKYNKKEGVLIKKKEPVSERENEMLQDRFIYAKLEKYKADIEKFTDRSQEFSVLINVWVDYPNGRKSLFGIKEGTDARTRLFKNNIAFYEDILIPVNKKPVPYRYKEKSLNFNKETESITFTVEYLPRKMFLTGAF
jgi:uncharacterized protein (UPF0216 family)